MYKISPFQFQYQNFNKDFSVGKKIFSNEEINIEKNGLYLIAGNSGNGKSTFLHLLKGIVPCFIPGKLEGEIYFNRIKFDENSIENFKDKIVYLFQNPFSQIIHNNLNLEFAFTLENLKVNADIYLDKKNELGERFEINHLWNTKSSQISNGECQKLVLASLIALSPEVILLDEPTAFLDPESRREFYKVLSLIKKNHIVIMVDHHLKEIQDIVDVTYWVDETGEISNKKNIVSSINVNENLAASFVNIKEKLAIEVNCLNFGYNSKDILFDNLNFKIENGEVLVIKGKNGQGKSTLFKILTGILKPISGQVKYFSDQNKLNQRSIFDIVGFVFQNPESSFFYNTLQEEFGGRENELVKSFFSEGELERSPYLFSEGQKRRISILINLFSNKKIIFYDEPTFGQDELNKNKIRDIIKDLKNKNYIQVIISHDDDFVENVATRILELKDQGLYEIK